MDAFENDPSNRGLLRLVGRFSKDSLPHVLDFKLRHYRDPFVRKVYRARAREAFNKKVMPLVSYHERWLEVTICYSHSGDKKTLVNTLSTVLVLSIE